MAHRVILRQCSSSVGFGPKQTLSDANRTGFMSTRPKLTKEGTRFFGLYSSIASSADERAAGGEPG